MLPEHTSKEIIGTRGMQLRDKRIVLCITGSVAASESPEIARTLMRHGAEVFAAMSEMAQKIIHPYLIEWATGNDVVLELTGKIEHVALAGAHPKKADLILVAPATSNTISKIACGIDDTPVTSIVSSAFGSNIPIMIVPAMHESMYNHPILKENIFKLKRLGVEFVGPRIEEGKAKIANTEDIVNAVVNKLAGKRDFSGRHILITAGPTLEPIDPVRVITNRSSGKMGMAIAEEALARGAQVTLVYGSSKVTPPANADLISVETTDQMFEAVVSKLKTGKYDIVVAAAAAADWMLEKPFSYKVSTHKLKALNLELKPTPKIIDYVKKACPRVFLVAFRAEYDLARNKLVESAYKRLLDAKADLIVVNDVSKKGVGFGTDTNEVFVIDKQKRTIHVPLAGKREVAKRILDVVKERIKPK